MAEVKEITVQDCEELYTKFKKYTETAEQHEFAKLAMINVMLDRTMKEIREAGVVADQRDARAMFRTVLLVIHEDSSAYREA